MKHIAVVGTEQFTVGFRLAGVTHVVNVESTKDGVTPLLSDESVGVLVIEDSYFSTLDSDLQERCNSSVNPVTVVLGTQDSGDSLKALIKKSIGVDME